MLPSDKKIAVMNDGRKIAYLLDGICYDQKTGAKIGYLEGDKYISNFGESDQSDRIEGDRLIKNGKELVLKIME